jgi:hypothetical protein
MDMGMHMKMENNYLFDKTHFVNAFSIGQYTNHRFEQMFNLVNSAKSRTRTRLTNEHLH